MFFEKNLKIFCFIENCSNKVGQRSSESINLSARIACRGTRTFGLVCCKFIADMIYCCRKGMVAAVSAPLRKGVYIQMVDMIYIISFAVLLVALNEVIKNIKKK